MQRWMIITVATLLGVLIYVVQRALKINKTRQEESEVFMKEVQDTLGLKLNTQPRDQYEIRKKAVFNKHREELDLVDSQYDDKLEAAGQCWLRSIPAKECATLKSALLKRAMAVLPVVTQLQGQAQSRMNLLQRGFIGEKQWMLTLNLKNEINEEFMTITLEGDRIQEDYGTSGKIFREARTFFEHEQVKRQQEMIRSQIISQVVAQGRSPTEASRIADEEIRRLQATVNQQES